MAQVIKIFHHETKLIYPIDTFNNMAANDLGHLLLTEIN